MSIPDSSERMPLKKRAITKVGDKVLEAFDCHKDDLGMFIFPVNESGYPKIMGM
ncbi:hypothetical protein [Bartonella heixiaziensis]|uniref:hypothetical protein n=1 Tax=Bartonella heixiaziensis TaxID=1461000 RepID=UPI003D23CF41